MRGRKIQRPLCAGSLGRARLRMSHGIYASAAIAFALALLPTGTSAQSSAKAKPAKVSSSALQAVHRVAIQVNQNDKAVMELALNNAKNVIEYYASKGETVAVEIVTYGPGLHMLRSDTSPVKERVAVMSLENSNLTFAACGNTQANQSKAESKPVVLLGEAKVTPSGVVRLMELQKQGYAYIRP
jgi:intracellular sulfur oxidation DsrE/DsrF family protein